ncbi:MAG: NPCBM/NEW2 domain-containing protein [Sedimentisphaeraceae bacterium JB056]
MESLNRIIRLSGMFLFIISVYVFAGDISDIDLPIISTSQGWGKLGINTVVVSPNKTKPRAISLMNKTYANGLGTHAPSRIVMNLAGEYDSFKALAGVQSGNTTGTVVFQVVLDGEKVFDSGIMKGDITPAKVDVSVKGGKKLELVVTDAGDGKAGDIANWADIELVSSPGKKPSFGYELSDIADQGYVVTWDFRNSHYSYPRRSEELEIDDLFFDRFMVPLEDGSYMLTTMPTTGQGLIGLQWYSRRNLDQLYIEFKNPERIPPNAQVRVEYWIGGTQFEGQWAALPGKLVKEAKGLRYLISENCNVRKDGTFKVRWYFSQAIPSYIFTKLQALTKFPWQNETFRIEFEDVASPLKIECRNAQFVKSENSENELMLDTSKPAFVKVRYCYSGTNNSERSVISFNMPDYPFAVDIMDIFEEGCVYIKDLGVFIATSDNKLTLKEYKKQVEAKQTTLAKVRQMPDQSFERVMDAIHPSCQDSGPAMLSLACDNNKFILRRDGSLRYIQNLEAPASHRKSERGHRDEFRRDIIEIVPYFGSLEPSENPHRGWPWFTSAKYPGETRSLEGSYYPAPLITVPCDGIDYKQKSFVAPFGEPLADDDTGFYNTKPLFVSQFNINNTSGTSKEASLRLKLIEDIRTNASPVIRKVPTGYVVMKDQRLMAFVDISSLNSLSLGIDDGKIAIKGRMSAGVSEHCTVFIPAWTAQRDIYKSLSGLNTTKLLNDTKRYWDSFLACGTNIELPNSELTNLIKASIINCTITARNERDHTNIGPWVSAAHFGIMESESQSIIEGMSLMGHQKFARNALDFFIARYNNDGMLTSGYTLMGLGWHLRVLGRYYELYSDDVWLKNNEQKVSSACDWIVKQHEKTKMFTPDGKRVLEYGLMPPGTAADWPALLYRLRPQAEFYAGLNAAANALEKIADPDADSYLVKADELRDDIICSYRNTQKYCPAVPIGDGSYVPYCPTVATQFGNMKDMIGGHVAAKDVSMGAQHLVVLGVLEPDAKDGYFKANRFEDRYFMAPTVDFPVDKIDADWFDFTGFYRGQPYYPRITDVYALNDDIKPFIRSYFNNIAPIVNMELLTFWEHFHATGGWNKTHETGWFLQQTRMMLLNEKDNELWIAPFVTDNWMQDGMRIAVNDLPTKFGEVSFEIKSEVEKGYVEAVISSPERTKPKSIVLRLRHPQQKQMKFVTVNGKFCSDFDTDKEIIRIDSFGSDIIVRASF